MPFIYPPPAEGLEETISWRSPEANYFRPRASSETRWKKEEEYRGESVGWRSLSRDQSRMRFLRRPEPRPDEEISSHVGPSLMITNPLLKKVLRPPPPPYTPPKRSASLDRNPEGRKTSSLPPPPYNSSTLPNGSGSSLKSFSEQIQLLNSLTKAWDSNEAVNSNKRKKENRPPSIYNSLATPKITPEAQLYWKYGISNGKPGGNRVRFKEELCTYLP